MTKYRNTYKKDKPLFSRDEHDRPQKQKNWARKKITEIDIWKCSLTNYDLKLVPMLFLCVN